MKKTKFLALALVAVMGLSLAACSKPADTTGDVATTPTDPKVEFSMATTLNPDHPAAQALQFFADKALEKSGGSVVLTLFPNSQLGGNNEIIESCKSGTVNIMPMANVSGLGQFSAKASVIGLPYVFQDENHLHKAIDGEVGQIINEDLKANGFKVLYWVDGGFRSVITKDKPIATTKDLKGLRIRVQPNEVATNTLNAMGAAAVGMNQGDVYSALEQKMLDGWENNPQTLLSLKLYEVSKAFSFTNHFTAPDLVVMNAAMFDKLTDNQKKALEEAALEAQAFQRDLWAKSTSETIEELKGLGVTFTDVADLTPFVTATQSVRDNWGKTNGTELLEKIEAAKN